MVFILALVLACLGWSVSRDLFAPFVVGPGMWAVIIGCYYLLPNEFYPVCHEFPMAVCIWMTAFFVASVYTSRKVHGSVVDLRVAQEPNPWIMRAYVAITVTTIPVISAIILWTAFTKDPEAMFRYIRVLSTGGSDDVEPIDFGILAYGFSVTFMCLFFVLMYFKNKWVIGTVIFMNLLVGVVTMAKINFLSVFFTILYLGYVRKVFKLKHFAWGIGGFLVLSFILQTIREYGSDVTVGDSLSLYTAASMVCFDYYAEPCTAVHFGENTFRFLYALGHPLGLCAEPIQTILPFVSIPFLANTYTILYPFYTDFGLFGVGLFAVVYGVIYGYYYKKSQSGGNVELIVYALFLVFLFLEFFAELIFTNLSLTIQYVVLAVLPFLFSKKQYKQHKNEPG